MSLEDIPASGMRQMIQETHDSTIRQEIMLKQSLERHAATELIASQHGTRIQTLENNDLIRQTELNFMKRVGAVLLAMGGLIIAWVKGK